MTRALVVLALWTPLVVAACCKPTVVERPVTVAPPPCRERDHPEPPDAASGSQAWADWFALELVPWIIEVEAACPRAP